MLLVLLALTDARAGSPTTAYRTGLSEPTGWEEVSRKQVDGVGEILIRHKQIDGTDCLEGSTSAPLSADLFLAAAADIPNQPGWSSWKVPVSVKLGTDPTRFDYYQLLDNPSPIADRYWFLAGTVSRVGEERVFAWEWVDPAARHPAALASLTTRFPDAIMTRVNVGDWTFTPQGGTTRVRYRICTDAGGDIPRWLGELAATRTLPTNVADIVAEVRRRGGG